MWLATDLLQKAGRKYASLRLHAFWIPCSWYSDRTMSRKRFQNELVTGCVLLCSPGVALSPCHWRLLSEAACWKSKFWNDVCHLFCLWHFYNSNSYYTVSKNLNSNEWVSVLLGSINTLNIFLKSLSPERKEVLGEEL